MDTVLCVCTSISGIILLWLSLSTLKETEQKKKHNDSDSICSQKERLPFTVSHRLKKITWFEDTARWGVCMFPYKLYK